MTTPQTTTLLLVEDDALALDAFAKIIALKGVNVLRAASVSMGMEFLKSGPNWIVCDLVLPDGGGEEIVTANATMPHPAQVIIITAIEDDERIGRLWRRGVVAILKKPVNLTTFFHLLGL